MSRELLACPATLDHAMALMPHIRAEDRAEWVAGTGDPTRLRLAAAVLDPNGFARSIFASDVDYPLLIWGASAKVGGDGEVGQAWLIASRDAIRYVLALHALLPSELAVLDEAFPKTVAYADKRNGVHHRWLSWLGFENLGEARMGPWNLPFLIFERIPRECASPCPSSAPS